MKKRTLQGRYSVKPWRKRLAHLAGMVDDLQKQCECSIGWQRNYCKMWTVSVDCDVVPEAETFIALCRLVMPDLREIEEKETGFGRVIRGVIKGMRPKCKRVKGTKYKETKATCPKNT